MEPTFALMVITDEGHAVLERVRRALVGVEAGRVAVQLRHKGASARELFELATELRGLTREAGALLIVNDRVDVALAVDADGVQLPERGLSAEVARRLLGPDKLVGCSCHDADGLDRAAALGASYATLAPVHAVPGKGTPLGLHGFAALVARARLPVYALGGIGANDVAPLLAAGARGVAVIREVMQADDPAAQVRALLADG